MDDYTIGRLESVVTLVSRERLTRLKQYHTLLMKWQSHINLVSDNTNIWERHIVDSAQLFPLLPDPRAVIADLGSGAGFPGLVLAILGATAMHLVESDQRKAAFLREAARITETPVTVHVTRAEHATLPPCDVITSRALAPLDALLTLAAPHLRADAFCIFPKGRKWSMEVDDARKHWQFDLAAQPSKTDSGSAILILRRIAGAMHDDIDCKDA